MEDLVREGDRGWSDLGRESWVEPEEGEEDEGGGGVRGSLGSARRLSANSSAHSLHTFFPQHPNSRFTFLVLNLAPQASRSMLLDQ